MNAVLTSAVGSFTLLVAFSSQAATAVEQLQQLRIEAQSGPASKLTSTLLTLKDLANTAGVSKAASARGLLEEALDARNGYVLISAYGPDPQALRVELEAKGLIQAKAHATSVSGRAPIDRIFEMAQISGLTYMKESVPMLNAGIVTSQGDKSLYSDLARQQFGVDGTGVRVGVISDSYDCLPPPFDPEWRVITAATDIASGDLPAGTHVLSDGEFCKTDQSPNSDEGRAMMQIIHDVAPGASLSFYSGTRGQEDFAEGVLKLAQDGATIIVDDLRYRDEPVFENGVIAKAVNTVKKQGVAYFSSAGNYGRVSYESAFRPERVANIEGVRHDFDPGQGVDTLQHITMSGAGISVLNVSWDEPSITANGVKGSASNVDVLFYDMDGQPLPVCREDLTSGPCQVPGVADNTGLDAFETVFLLNQDRSSNPLPVELQLSIEVRSGPAPTRVKYQYGATLTLREYDTHSGTLTGHANAEGAEAVGGAWWFDTGAYGAANHPVCNDACVNSYSSPGGTPLLIDEQGGRRNKPYIGFKPGVTGPDGGNTTFFVASAPRFRAPGEPDSFPNFFGTSAAAPHVAAVAALLLDQRNRDIAAGKRFNGPQILTPDAMIEALRASAADIKRRSLDEQDATKTEEIPEAEGFDFDSGFGLVNAQKALELIQGF